MGLSNLWLRTAQPGSPPTSTGTPLFFSDFLLVSSRDATKGRRKPKKYGFIFSQKNSFILLPAYGVSILDTDWQRSWESETCNDSFMR
jgi:hypothetical protein